jgi:hypothetical protein
MYLLAGYLKNYSKYKFRSDVIERTKGYFRFKDES